MHGGEAAFNELYRSTHQKVARYCLRRLPPEAAKDALTETYVVAWRRFSDIPADDEALPWLYGIARNVVRNNARSARRLMRLRSRLAGEPSEHAPDPARQVIRSDDDRRFLAMVDELPANDREILRLRAFEGLDYDEIALVLGISSGAARQRLSRATKRLARRLGDLAEHAPRATQEGGRRAG